MHILTNTDIFIRLLAAAVFGSIVGYERELTGQDAGFRTHILVSVGAAIFTVIQLEAVEWVSIVTLENPDLVGVLSSDATRLVAQIVSGIGFLGAGTIIVTNRAVKGLTTAASIWAIASIGMAAGFGHYFLATVGTMIIFVVLHLVQRVLYVEDTKQIHLSYTHRDETLQNILDFFHSKHLRILRIEYNVDLMTENGPVSHDIFVVGIPQNQSVSDLMNGLMDISHIMNISIERTNPTL